jgi:hypothetical protein
MGGYLHVWLNQGLKIASLAFLVKRVLCGYLVSPGKTDNCLWLYFSVVYILDMYTLYIY